MWNSSPILGMGLYIWLGAGRLICGKRTEDYTEKRLLLQVRMSCRWRKAILQYQKGMFPTVLIACRWWHALTSPSSLALKQGELCSTAGFLYTSRNLRPFLCISLEGLVTQGLWCNVQTPKEDALPCKGTTPVKVLGQPEWSVPLPSGKGLTRTRIIS